MLNSFAYHPHSTIPKAIADFLTGQNRTIEQAKKVEFWMAGEGMDDLSLRMERDMAARLGHSLDNMRRFRVECDDFVYSGYLARQDGDCWFVCVVDLFYIVKAKEKIGEEME